jgi:hypothetical protein
MSFMNRKALGLLATGSIAAALMTVAPSASAQVSYLSSQSDPELAAIVEPSAPSPDAPAPAPGGVPAHKGFQMALGSGYSIPFGDVDASLPASDFMSGQVPLLLDIGYKTSPHLYIGGYVGYGFGRAGKMVDCLCSESGVDCSLSTLRIGVNLQYHFFPAEKINPYIGYGIGYESATFKASGPGGRAEITASGFELARLTAGADFRTNSVIGFGPYADLGLGMYTSLSDAYDSVSVQDPTMHGWFNLGVRMMLFP